MFLLSSAVERPAVNRMVAGSIPAVGVPHVCKRTGDSVTSRRSFILFQLRGVTL